MIMTFMQLLGFSAVEVNHSTAVRGSAMDSDRGSSVMCRSSCVWGVLRAHQIRSFYSKSPSSTSACAEKPLPT